jgi:hypothetical protein
VFIVVGVSSDEYAHHPWSLELVAAPKLMTLAERVMPTADRITVHKNTSFGWKLRPVTLRVDPFDVCDRNVPFATSTS